jgi:hypothetical protein
MGGTSSTQQTQQSTTAPWAAAQPALQGILGQIDGLLPTTGVTPGEQASLDTIINNANSTSQFNPQINASTSNLLNGGGALNQAGAVNQNYQNYYNQTNPLASNTNYDPMSTPGIGDQLQSLKDSISTGINGQFAAAGRDMSGYNQKALGQGLTAGLAPILTGNTNAGILSGMQQQSNQNQQAGVNQVGTGLQAQNAGASTALAAYLQQQGIPLQNLGLLANIGVPIAGLGSQSTGQSQGSSTMSGADQFAKIGQGAASFGKLLFG